MQLDTRTLLGTIALAAALALLSPGVKLVRADEPAPAAPAPAAAPISQDGPSCEAGDRSAETKIEQLQALMRTQELRALAEQQARQVDSDVIVLNNSGYNYKPKPPPVADPAMQELQDLGLD
jgi:hypothetical protein